jgi:ubiquinol-cytochrome c reductase cytochrome b subunit/cytochrome b6
MKAWLKARVPIDLDRLSELSNEPVPGHLKRWWFALGGTPAYLFMVQLATGILLLFYYVPEPGRAYESVAHLSHQVAFGWWIRSLHKWSATGMIVAVGLHTLRVFFTGSYRKPRELTWVLGCLLFFCTLAEGISGYSLVYEQLSYWGATVTANLTGALPGIGGFLSRLVRGGDEVGGSTLTRFFVVHTAILPIAITMVVAAHIALVRIHGMSSETRFRSQESEPRTFPFIPDHVLTEMMIALVLMVVLNVLAVMLPASLGEPANPSVTPEHIRPEWYFYFAFRWLKLTSLRVGVLGVMTAALVMMCWPAVDAGLRKLAPKRDLSIAFGMAAVLVVVALTVWEALA